MLVHIPTSEMQDAGHDMHSGQGESLKFLCHTLSIYRHVLEATVAYLELVEVVDLRDCNSFRVGGRICCVQAVHICQQKQPVCPYKGRNLHVIKLIVISATIIVIIINVKHASQG